MCFKNIITVFLFHCAKWNAGILRLLYGLIYFKKSCHIDTNIENSQYHHTVYK